MRKTEIKIETEAEKAKANLECGKRHGAASAAMAALICLLVMTSPLMMKTLAGYMSKTSASRNAEIAGYALVVDVPDAAASVIQNETWDYGKIISLDNRSQTALTYDIVVSLEGRASWPEGLTAVLVTADGEKADGRVSGSRCVFTDNGWRLAPGECVQDVYGLKLATTYDTEPGDYHFSISSVTYQVD